MTSCTICPRTAPDGHHACPLCAHQLHAWLADLPHQAALLEAFVEPGARDPQRGRLGGTGRAHAPVPADLRVLTLLGPGHPQPPDDNPDPDDTIPIRALLDGWAGYIAYEHHAVTRDRRHGTTHIQPCDAAHPTHGATITGWCTWLLAYLPYALTRPWVRDLHHQIGDLLAVIRTLTHAVPHHHPQGAPCPKCATFALVVTDGQWGVTCQACGHHLEPEEYDQHSARFLRTVQAATEA